MNSRENNAENFTNRLEGENSVMIIDTTNYRKSLKVYAIQAFPEGWGMHVSRMNSGEKNEENYANRLGENSTMIKDTTNTRKLPKVYAIRTFPKGCGVPHAPRMNSRENNEENFANRLEGENSTMIANTTNTRKRPKVYAIRTFPKGCGLLHASRLNLGKNNKSSANRLEEKNLAITLRVSRMNSRENNEGSYANPVKVEDSAIIPHVSRMNSTENNEESSASHLEGENLTMIINTTNPRKSPKVYAIQTFSEGCGGPHASRMNSRENKEGSSANPLKGEDSAIIQHVCKMNSREKREESFASHLEGENSAMIINTSNPSNSPKVYAIQTFLEGCGALHASRMDLGEKYMEHSTIMVVNNHRLENSAIIDTTNPRKSPPSSIMRTTIARESPPSSIITATHVASQSPNSSILSTTLARKSSPSRISKESSPPPMADNKVPLQANDFNRNKVKYALHCFQEVLWKLLEENGSRCRADTMAAKLLKKKLKWINTARRVGAIPGVQVGDVFEWIAELNVIGLHHQSLNGIDFMKMTNGTTLATSVVASGRYANVFESSDVLIYSGHGGNPSLKSGHPQDQRLVRGNLALKNSMEARTPVRVIRGFRFSKSCKFKRTSFKKNTVYVYDGLYYVEEYWQEKGHFGKLVFMFSLKRILGQPRLLLPWPTKQVEKL